MKRRRFLQSSAVATAAVSAPLWAGSQRSELPLLLVDRAVAQTTAGAVILADGETLSPAHLRLFQQDEFYGVLSPANAVILDELLRFERGVTVENVSAAATDVLKTCCQEAQLVWVRGYIGTYLS